MFYYLHPSTNGYGGGVCRDWFLGLISSSSIGFSIQPMTSAELNCAGSLFHPFAALSLVRCPPLSIPGITGTLQYVPSIQFPGGRGRHKKRLLLTTPLLFSVFLTMPLCVPIILFYPIPRAAPPPLVPGREGPLSLSILAIDTLNDLTCP